MLQGIRQGGGKATHIPWASRAMSWGLKQMSPRARDLLASGQRAPQAPSMAASVCLPVFAELTLGRLSARMQNPLPLSLLSGCFSALVFFGLSSQRRLRELREEEVEGLDPDRCQGREGMSLPAGRASNPTKIESNRVSPRPRSSQNNLHFLSPFILLIYNWPKL